MRTSRRVSWNDCDPSGRIRFQAVFDWFVDAEVEFLRELGIAELFGAMPRVAADARWTGGIWFGDVVEIDEHVGRSSLRYRFAVTNAGSEAVSGSVTCVYAPEGRSAPIPDASRSALEGR